MCICTCMPVLPLLGPYIAQVGHSLSLEALCPHENLTFTMPTVALPAAFKRTQCIIPAPMSVCDMLLLCTAVCGKRESETSPTGVRAVDSVGFRQIHVLPMYLCVLSMAVLPWQHIGCIGRKCMLLHTQETFSSQKGVARNEVE